MSSKKIKVFISYAHEEDKYFGIFRDGLERHLFTASGEYDFGTWDDSDIVPSDSWNSTIQQNLNDAGIAILCVSASFLKSKYIKEHELGVLLRNHRDKLIFPVYFNYCDINFSKDLSQIQFFIQKGDQYNLPQGKDFVFCDLVSFSKTDGSFIPNPKIDFYFKNFVEKIKQALDKKSSDSSFKTDLPEPLNPPDHPDPPGVNRNPFEKVLHTITKILLLLSMVFFLGYVCYTLLYTHDDSRKFNAGLGCTMFLGSFLLQNIGKLKSNQPSYE